MSNNSVYEINTALWDGKGSDEIGISVPDAGRLCLRIKPSPFLRQNLHIAKPKGKLC